MDLASAPTLLAEPAPAEAAVAAHRWRAGRVWRGRPDDASWVRPALIALLVVTAMLYLVDLSVSGWANSFYSAAVEAAAKSWKAMFFGSSDSSNFITVDKPPASLWVMDISARLFGVNSWSVLVPEALEGVASVGVLYLAVRRWFSPGAALMAGGVLAVTPVAILMFRFNNPDALLVLLLTLAAYAMMRAVEAAQTRWILLAGSLIGLGFLTKMLQALVVVPVFALVYLMAAPSPLRRRILQLLAGGLAMVVAGGWWVAIVELIPAANRPYIGGSQDNSLLNLIFGYNGFGRLSGNEAGSVGGGGTAGSRWGITGWLRLFNSDMGGQISWLLPAALILAVAVIAYTRHAARTDRLRAAVLLWGGWLVLTGAIFSLGQGIIHPYYTVALAPAIAALVGIGVTYMWSRRSATAARVVLSSVLVATAVWSYWLLRRSPTWHPWIRYAVLVVGVVVGVLLLLPRSRIRHRPLVALVAAAIAVSLGGPTVYSLQTVTTSYTTAIPSAGPAVSGGGFGGGGGGFGGGRFGGAGRFGRTFGSSGGFQGGGAPKQGAGAFGPRSGQGAHAFFGGRRFGGGGGGGGGGGFLSAATPSRAVTKLLEQNAGRYTWIAATVDSNSAAGYQLASDQPVMAIGGFNGTDPTPSLQVFKSDVSKRRIHYFVASSGGFGGGGGFGASTSTTNSDASAITSWVETHFKAQTVGSATVYDLAP